MLRCDLSCLLTSSVKELRLAPNVAPHCRSIGRSNVAVIGEQREVARVALRILLPVAMASILSLESTAAILPPNNGTSRTVDVRFPVPKYYQHYATQDGNPVPTTGRLFLLLPPNFDPRRVWPILIVTATKDPGRTGPSDAPWYRAAAAAEGCIVLATDATVRPRNDSVAGISGGAKCAQWLGAILAQTHSLNIRGFFLSGINEEKCPRR